MACSDGVFEDDSNLKGQIECLREMISDLRTEFEGVSKEANNLSSSLGDTWNVLDDMRGTVKNMKDEMWKFTKTAKLQYELGEKIAKSYKETALNIGLSTKRSAALSQEFKGALAEVSKFGGDISDVESIYKDFADSSGRVRILGDDEVSNIFKLGEATNLYGSEAASLYETLDLMGVSNELATERMVELVKESQSIGLNSSKVSKMMASSMKSMQAYSFAGGVKGMTEMAKQAVKMRLDVSDVLGMADKFYQPEAALEAAANLQMLGGDIAQAFGDPFETMYLARNKPEELAKRLGEMTENMLQFNEETKQYELPAEARMQLKAAGEQLGIDVNKMTEMARQTAKLKDAKNILSSEGMFSDEEMEGIGNLSRLNKEGQMVVDFLDEDGKKQTKALEDLSSGEAEMILRSPENEKEYMDVMLYEAQTSNKLLENIYKSFEYGFVADMDYYKTVEELTKESIKNTAKFGGKSKEAFGETRMGGMMSKGGEVVENLTKTINDKISGQITTLMEKINITDLDVDAMDEMIINAENLNLNAPKDTSVILHPDTSVNPVNEKSSAQAAAASTMNHVGSVAMTLTVIDNGNTLGANISSSQLAKEIIKGAQGVIWNGGTQSGSEAGDTVG